MVSSMRLRFFLRTAHIRTHEYTCLLPSTVSDSTESLTAALSGANSLVIAVGFVPSNPLKMAAAAHEVE